MSSRSPPALSAPATPRKIVASDSSIFCQMRYAVARFRPWNEMRSIRASTSSADRFASTRNGSIGFFRKRCFFTGSLYARGVGGQAAPSKRVSDPPEPCRTLLPVRGVAAQGDAAGDRKRQVVTHNDVRRNLEPGAGVGIAEAKGVSPGMRGIKKDSRVKLSEEQGERTDPAFNVPERQAIVHVDDRRAVAHDVVGRKPAREADDVAPKSDRRRRSRRAARPQNTAPVAIAI